MPALKFVKMVELDVGKKESAWIEGAALRCVIIGSLNKDMHEPHSIATRKRSVPSLEESIKSIQLDENNDIKLTAKVLKLFFFFLGQERKSCNRSCDCGNCRPEGSFASANSSSFRNPCKNYRSSSFRTFEIFRNPCKNYRRKVFLSFSMARTNQEICAAD